MVATKDLAGKDVVNSAGFEFIPPVTVDLPIKTFTLNRIEYVNQNRKIDEYIHAVNSDPFWGFSPWQVWVENITASENRILNGSARSWNVSYDISVNTWKYGWKTAILDAGKVEKTDSYVQGERLVEPIKYGNNADVTDPVALNGNGRKLVDGEEPHYIEFEFLGKKDLNLMHIPNPYS